MRNSASPDTLEVLEFSAVLEGVARRAVSALGQEDIRSRRPRGEAVWARAELARVAEVLDFLESARDFVPPDAPDARAALARLKVEGGVLEPSHLLDLGRLLAESRALHRGLGEATPDHPTLQATRELLLAAPEWESRIGSTVDESGAILDSASRELGRIRSDLRRAHTRIVRKLESFLKTLPERFVVPDASVTLRNGRYVVPVRREGKGEVGGIVHDESGSGQTLFMEPPLALQLMNELRDLERDEAREIERILREISAAFRPHRDAFQGSLDALVRFDSLYGRARMAGEWDGVPPELVDFDDDGLRVRTGRHPLLLLRGEGDVVPFDLEMDPRERILVVSGPNTGGKSVLLKSLGLLTLLAQAGIVPPVGKGTRLPLVRRVFTDIGDRQSIAESLSTFSAHLARLREIVEEAGPGDLVLIDEMGTGTDPAEGAALARSILERLVGCGALAVVTSHLGALKTLDAPGSGIVNASLQFDPHHMEPTYQLTKGRPGRSYGLAIARRMGLPPDLLDRAEGLLGAGEASLEDVLERLEVQEIRARELSAELASEKAEVARLREELRERERAVREAERTAEVRTREEARRILMEARAEVEQAIQEVKEAGARAQEEASRQARRRVEEAARAQSRAARKARERARSSQDAGPAPDLEPGDRVRVLGGGAKGVVVALEEGKATVEAGPVRLQVPVGELSLLERGTARPGSGPGGGGAGGGGGSPGRGRAAGQTVPLAGSLPELEPAHEVDLRGMRVDEAALEVSRALDGALMTGLSEIRIIHGKGTGALRARVSEVLKADRRVASHRMGLPTEGGAGVTVAVLR